MGFTALHGLAAKGMTSEIQKLFDHDWVFIPEEVDEWGSNALHYAAEGGHADCIALLLDKSIDIQFQDHSGHTALILAAQEARADAVQLLIQRNADVNARNKAGRTALHQILDADLPHASPSSPSQSTRKPSSLPPPVKALPPVRSKNSAQSRVSLDAMLTTPKSAALRETGEGRGGGRGEGLLGLTPALSRGVAWDTGEDCGLPPPLHLRPPPLLGEGWEGGAGGGVEAGAVIVGALLAGGGAVDTQDGYGDTALHIAAEKGKQWAVELLLAAHANTRVRNVFHRTAADVAATDAIRSALLLAEETGGGVTLSTGRAA